MENKILHTIKYMRHRPKMFFWNDDTFNSYIIYFQGFFYSFDCSTNIDLEREISGWYQKRVKFKAPNMSWFSQFEHVNKNLTEIEKIEKLLDTLEIFFKEYFSNKSYP
ncbi:hypothetical protein NZD88_09030 [Chryseobacterium antibioticum]|uniref:GIY-YIG nuclease family protein n=1 Tax=Chryseobacterium pyrolae TaxID=2987481 RepID=A0ABT2IH33_9FLAO|nr:hypothetical protein [Chryseobacterium pyrolae]MCT2407678.1 hypothetical protein [Chryseobacterium pyrolae]